jgi:hypothetical protein
VKERGCVMKLASVAHSFTHKKGGGSQGSELGFLFLPTDNTLVTTTTFIYKNVSGRELTHNTIGRGAA